MEKRLTFLVLTSNIMNKIYIIFIGILLTVLSIWLISNEFPMKKMNYVADYHRDNILSYEHHKATNRFEINGDYNTYISIIDWLKILHLNIRKKNLRNYLVMNNSPL